MAVEALPLTTREPELHHGADPGLVWLPGEIDLLNSHRLVTDARKALMAGASRIRVDLSATTFMDASGIHALLAAREAADSYGVPFSVHGPTGAVRRVIDLTGTHERLGVATAV